MKFFKHFLIGLIFIGINNNLSAQSKQTEVVKNIEPIELNAILASNSKVQLVDVRTPSEFNTGHINKALNINYYDRDFSQQISKLDKSKPIYVYCRSGVRSKYSSEILKKLGFKKIYNLKGGILSWSSQNLPLEK